MEDKANNLNRNAFLFVSFIFLGFTISVVWHYAMAQYLGRGYPASTFLFSPLDKFSDYFNPFLALKRYSNPYNYFGQHGVLMPYLPLTFVFLKPFTFLGYRASFFCFTTMSIAIIFLVVHFSLRSLFRDWLLAGILSLALSFAIYPFAFELDRGNVEILTFGLVALFLWAFRNDKVWSFLPLAAAISMKLYPGVLIFLFVGKKNKLVLWVVISTLLITLISYALISLWSGDKFGAVVIQQLSQMAAHAPTYSFQMAGLQHNHTLWGVVLGLNGLWKTLHGQLILDWTIASRIYAIIVLVAFAVIVSFICTRNIADWKKLTALLACMLLFPYTSFDYTLMHWFFVPVAYLYSTREKFSIFILIILTVPLVPMDYLIIKADVTISVLIYTFAILSSLFIVLFIPERSHA